MLLRSTGIYTAVGIVSGALSFALLPVMTRWLDPAEYGHLAVYQTLVSFAVSLIGLNVHGAIGRRWFDSDRSGFPVFVGTCMVVLLMSTAAAAILTLLWAGVLGSALSFPSDWMWTVWATATAQFILLCCLTIAQSAQRPVLYAILQLGTVLLNAGLSLLLVVVLVSGWTGRVWATMGSLLLSAAIALPLMYRLGWLRPAWNAVDARRAFAFGLPLVPHALAGWALGNLDRLIVAYLLGPSQTGLMLVAFQFATVVAMVEDSFNRAWAPWFMERLRSGGSGARVVLAACIWRYAVALLLFAILVGLAAPSLAGWVLGPRFGDAGEVAFWYCLASAIGGLYKMAANQLFWAEWTWGVLAASSSAAVALAPACVLGVHIGGAVGAAMAVVLAQSLLLTIAAILGQRAAPLPWVAGLRLALRPTWRIA